MTTSEPGGAGPGSGGALPAPSPSLPSSAPGTSEVHLLPIHHSPRTPEVPAMPPGLPRLPTVPTGLADIAGRIHDLPESVAIRVDEAQNDAHLNHAAAQLLAGLNLRSPGATREQLARPLTDPHVMPRVPTMPDSLADVAERIEGLPESISIRLDEASHNIVAQHFAKNFLGGPLGLSTDLPPIPSHNAPAAPAGLPAAAPAPSSALPGATNPFAFSFPLSNPPASPGLHPGGHPPPAVPRPGASPSLPRAGVPSVPPSFVPPSAPATPALPSEFAAFSGPLQPILSIPLATARLEDPRCLLDAAARMFQPTTRSYAEPAHWHQSVPALHPPAASASAASVAAGESAPADTPSYYFIDDQSGKAAVASGGGHGFDVDLVRRDFPILRQEVNGRPLVWLDNAATTQKPQAVIDRLVRFYSEENSNVHRAAHELAARATSAYEHAREKVQHFLAAPTKEEIIFTRGTTESINLLAQTLGNQIVGRDDEVLITHIEHHSNIVPWQHLVQRAGARLRVVPVNDRGEINLDAYERLLGPRTKIVAMTHVSNALGTVVPVREMTAAAHRHGAKVLVDAAQSVPHFPINVQDLGCDFLALSGHKLFGPTGVGVLFGRRELLDSMPPWQGGGNMIQNVTFEQTTYNPAPMKFEAGTAILAGAVGLGAAIEYLNRIGFERAAAYEHSLFLYATDALAAVPGLTFVGTAREKAGVLSFVLAGAQPEAIGEALNREGIAVRTGHHCAQPALRRFGHERTVRPSLAFYNTRGEIDHLVATLRRVTRG